jgi:hypothetical protein
VGNIAGYGSISSGNSNFIGTQAGYLANNCYGSNFIGQNAGQESVGSYKSNFFGYNAGYLTTNCYGCVFSGNTTGYLSNGSSFSNFIGSQAGYNTSASSFSSVIGYNAGYVSGSNSNSFGSNNIIIGTGITLPQSYSNGINLGGLIFGSGSYFNTATSSVSSGSANGKIGINQPNPLYSLDVSGSGNFSSGLNITGSLSISGSESILGSLTVSGSLTVTGSFVATSGSVTPLLFNRQTTNYTISLSDQGRVIEMNVGSGNIVTVPSSSTVNFPIGTEIAIVQRGTGTTLFTTASINVLIDSYSGSLTMKGQYAAASLLKVGTDEWYLFGRLLVNS